jgi:hypothetical protein
MRIKSVNGKLKTVLIDPFTKSCSWIEVDADYDAMLKAIDAECFDKVQLSKDHIIFADGEGRLKENLYHGWCPRGWGKTPIMGKCIVLTWNDNYEWESFSGKIEDVENVIGAWYEGAPPQPQIQVWSDSDKCRMCGNHNLDSLAMMSGRPLCKRCNERTAR